MSEATFKLSSRGVGTFEGDAIRNITGRFGGTYSITEGAFAGATRGTAIGYSGNSNLWGYLSFDASRVVPTATRNRVENIAVLPLIVAK